MRLKMLEEENKDLKSKVESLLHSNDRLKTELINRAKTDKLSETRKYHDTKYKSKYSKSSTPTNKVRNKYRYLSGKTLETIKSCEKSRIPKLPKYIGPMLH